MSTSNSIEIANSDQELVGSAKKRRQIKILVGLSAVAVIIIAAIVLSVVLVTKTDEAPPEDKREPLKLTDILSGALQPKRFNGTWINDNNFHYFDDSGNLVMFDVAEKKSEIFIPRSSDNFFTASTFEFSSDKKFILTASHIVKLFRHSFYALWNIYDVERKQSYPVTIGGQALAYRLVKFSPIDNSLIVVYNSNIYYKKSPIDTSEIQITTDGSQTNGIYNGVPDWVNEEEVFASNSATWFSPDGKKIAFVRFDDSKVPLMSLPVYGGVGDPAFQYPQTLPVNYPKVATKNPEVKLFYVDLSTVTDAASVVRREISAPTRLVNSQLDHLITSVSWANNDDLIAVFMNRVQSKGDILKCPTGSGQTTCDVAQTLDVEGGWVEFFTAPFFNKNGNELIFIWSVEKYRHVVSVDLNSFQLTPRTSGKFVVTEILKLNKEKNVIIFTANIENDSRVQHLFAVKNEAGAEKVCLTCGASFVSHSYFAAEVSEDGSNIIISANGPGVPQVHMYTLEVGNNITLTNHVELESNAILKKSLEGKKIPKIIYDKIVLDNGSESQVMMIVPSDLDENKPHPMIVEVYGGPDSSSVTTRWSIEWGTYMVSSRNIIYAKIDGRGSGLRGDENLFALYRKLGTVEVYDQIETADKLQKKHIYIDKSKSAIWGWSYGGYVSGMSLTNDNSSVYKCAVSVAPVTDWTLYDSIYTERYMGLPIANDNAEAYANSRLMKFVKNIPENNKTYMLVHGTLDDNVHFQQGMLLARTLERQDIQFKEITYPDEDHSLAGVRPHLYHSLERFFDNCFADQ